MGNAEHQHPVELLEGDFVGAGAVEQVEVSVPEDGFPPLLAVYAHSVELQAQHEGGIAGARDVLSGMADDSRFGAGFGEADFTNPGAREATGEGTAVDWIRHERGKGIPGQVVPILEPPMRR